MAKSLDNLDIVKSLDNSYILVDRDGELRKIKVGATGQGGGTNIQTVEVRINSSNIIEVYVYDFETMTVSNTTTIPSTVDCPILYEQRIDGPEETYYGYRVLFGFDYDGGDLDIRDSNNDEVFDSGMALILNNYSTTPITLPEYIEINDVQQGEY